MPTRSEVTRLLDQGLSYEDVGQRLDIAPGQAFMIATGLPADGSDSPHPSELRDRPVLPSSSQYLVNPRPHNPTRNDTVMRWVHERADRELKAGG